MTVARLPADASPTQLDPLTPLGGAQDVTVTRPAAPAALTQLDPLTTLGGPQDVTVTRAAAPAALTQLDPLTALGGAQDVTVTRPAAPAALTQLDSLTALGGPQDVTVARIPPPPAVAQLAGLAVAPEVLESGNPAAATISLDSPAPAGGTEIQIATAGAISAASLVVVPEGAQKVEFPVASRQVDVIATATLRASLDGLSVTAFMRLLPAAPGPAKLDVTRTEVRLVRAINLDGRSTNPFQVTDVRQRIGGALGQTCAFTLGGTVSIVGTTGSSFGQLIAGSPSNATLILRPVSSFRVNTGSAWTASNFAEGAVFADGRYTHTVADRSGASLTITYDVNVVPGTPDRVCVNVVSIAPTAAAPACAGTKGGTVSILKSATAVVGNDAAALAVVTAVSATTARINQGAGFTIGGVSDGAIIAEGNDIAAHLEDNSSADAFDITFDLDALSSKEVCISGITVVKEDPTP